MDFKDLNEPEINNEKQKEQIIQPEKRRYHRLYLILLLISLLLHLITLDMFFNFGLQKRGLRFLKQLTTEETKNKQTFVYFNPPSPKSKSFSMPKAIHTTPAVTPSPTVTKVLPAPEAKKEPENGLPASLKPRKSDFGIPDASDEIPEEDVLENKLGIKEQGDALAEGSDGDKEEKIIQAKEQIKIETTPEKASTAIDPEPIEALATKTSTMFSSAEKAARIKQIMAQQKILEQYQGQDFSEAATRPVAQASEKTSQKPTSFLSGDADNMSLRTKGKKQEGSGKKRNIIAMTKGFIENLKDEGDDWLERKGDDSKRPSFDELKYISYEEKITWSLQASWKQSFEHSPLHDMYHNDAVVDFSIDENGNLSNCELLQSTGNKDLDKMIIKNMQLASPYPPLPKHFNTKIYHTGRIIHVYPRQLSF